MRKTLAALAFVLTLFVFAAPVRAQRADVYPFDVKVGGQTATVEGNPQTTIFAKVKNPVAPDAELEVAGDAGMLLINVFPAKPDGSVDPAASAATKIIMVQSGTKAKLDATMDKSKLTPASTGPTSFSAEKPHG